MIAFKKTPQPAIITPKGSAALVGDTDPVKTGDIVPSETDKDRLKRMDTSGARRRMRETVEGNRLL